MSVRAEEALEGCWKSRQPDRAKLFVTVWLINTQTCSCSTGRRSFSVTSKRCFPTLHCFFSFSASYLFAYSILRAKLFSQEHQRLVRALIFSSSCESLCLSESTSVCVNSVTSNKCYIRVKQWEKTCLGFPEKFTAQWSQSERILF